MRRWWMFLLIPPILLLPSCQNETPSVSDTDLGISLTFSDALSGEAQDGRLILIVSKQEEGEPRFQTGAGPTGQQVFGIDVDGWAPGDAAIIDGDCAYLSGESGDYKQC